MLILKNNFESTVGNYLPSDFNNWLQYVIDFQREFWKLWFDKCSRVSSDSRWTKAHLCFANVQHFRTEDDQSFEVQNNCYADVCKPNWFSLSRLSNDWDMMFLDKFTSQTH